MKRLTLTVLAILVLLTGKTALAQPTPPSGMLLGIYAFPTWKGLRVTNTIPGYSAEGRLYRHDVLRRVTADGVAMYRTRNLWQLEHAKERIGPYRPAALEVFRPGHGLIYLWVEFRPVGGGPAARGVPARMEAKIMTESERPGARALFQAGQQNLPTGHLNRPGPGVIDPLHPRPIPQPAPQPPSGSANAASLFRR